jgi:glycosyltransferase involved in cell wall biosynthesis
VIPSFAAGERPARSLGIVSSFPPTPCGIATFSAALAAGLVANGCAVDVVRCGPTPEVEDVLVLASLDDPRGIRAGVDALNRTEVAILQHEYGLYDGPDGDAILAVLDALEVPSIVIAHTVLREPSMNQRAVLEELCRGADAVVVMTATARSRLVTGFDIDPSKVSTIPHGAATSSGLRVVRDRPFPARPQLLTWGLLGPGKGIEWAIDAVALLADVRPRPRYVVAGATHPKVLAEAGESYRRMLVSRAWRRGAAPYVSFDNAYRGLSDLTKLICSADLVVLPYDSDEQVTSGVLVDAVAAGRPVVSTAFPHAVELLSGGAGLIVPQRDPAALADAIRAVISDPDLAAAMAKEARGLAPGLSWNSVARQYITLADALLAVGEVVTA